jgi:hypothetical protein
LDASWIRDGETVSAVAEIRQARALTPAEIAWIALLPCAVATAAALPLLGSALGDLLFPPGSDMLWPLGFHLVQGNYEPAKHGRYVLAALAPLLLAGVVLVGARCAPRLPLWAIVALTYVSQALLLALLLVALLAQRNVLFPEIPPRRDIFDAGRLVAAAILVLLTFVIMNHRRRRELARRLTQEARIRRIVCLGVAALLAAVLLLKGVTTDRLSEDGGYFNWGLNDVFAILNGRTPLVDYHVLYAKLLPYPTALVLATFGTTGLVYTLAMAVLNLLAMLAVFADGVRPRRAWPLFLVGGLVAIDNLEFGLGAFLGTVMALLCARPPGSARAALQLAVEVAGGVLGAFTLVALLTFAHAGELPDPALLMEWPRIFTNLGLLALPVPIASLHLAIYATFAAAIVTAAVHVARGADDTLLTGMLAWSGVFGLVAANYYIGRPDEGKLASMFSAWAFALALLTIVAVRALAAQGWRRPTLPQMLALFGFALALTTISHLPQPQDQLARLTHETPEAAYRTSAERFVAARTHPGETVMILLPMSFRIAHDLGLRNVAPYVMQVAVVTRGQMQTVLDVARRERVRSIFVPAEGSWVAVEGGLAPEHRAAYREAGYPLVSYAPGFYELGKDGR